MKTRFRAYFLYFEFWRKLIFKLFHSFSAAGKAFWGPARSEACFLKTRQLELLFVIHLALLPLFFGKHSASHTPLILKILSSSIFEFPRLITHFWRQLIILT